MLKLQIIASLAVLMCGQVLWWRRRDNIFAYFQVGLFVASVVVPILGTSVLDSADPDVVALYARILLIGAPVYLLGLAYGGSLGLRARTPRVTFSLPFHDIPRPLALRVLLIASVALVALVGAFALLGYVPLFASNRLFAKYGIGPYRAGFERGAQVFHLAMNLASVISAVLLAVMVVRRRLVEVVLLTGILIGLASTLSRGEALVGPLTFLVAWGVQRGWRPWLLALIASSSFIAAALLNELIFLAEPVGGTPFAARVAQSAPDISDHLGFLNGYRLQGSERIGIRTIQAGYSLSSDKGSWDPAEYALRMRTGLSDVGELASGGLRLPAQVWGYAAYGYPGVVAWTFISGLFIGWGTTLLRRLLTRAEQERYRHQALNLVMAWLFYTGTFGILSLFYFPFRSDILLLGIALVLGLWPLRRTQVSEPEDVSAARP